MPPTARSTTRYTESIVGSIVSPKARAATLKLVPR
jgi:hypothetical protein